jgi:hypothetical protein
MLNILLGLIVFYICFRLITTLIIPKITAYRINRYKDKLKEDNPQLFERKHRGYTGKVHPSIRKYYEDENNKNKNDK